MKILLAHPQTQHSYKIASLLYKNNLLYKFHTSFNFPKSKAKFIPKFLQDYLSNRLINIPSNYLCTNYRLEIERNIVNKLLRLNYTNNYYRLNEYFQNSISDNDIQKSNIIIGFDGSSWLLGRKAIKYNKPFILDQTTVHPLFKKQLFEKYSKQYPNWSNELVCNKSVSQVKLHNIEIKNSQFISVGCQFIKDNLMEIGCDESKIIINPYGIDMSYFTPKTLLAPGKIRFLFFGTISSNKGIPTLLNAWKKLNSKNATLVLAGYGSMPIHIQLPANVEMLGSILPNQRKRLFDNSHVFVFPSLYEGFGQVLLEASSSGMPIISTFNTGAVDIVEEGINGFLIEPGDEEALSARMEYFIENPDRILEMGLKKNDFIRATFSLESYERRWLDLINKC